jgi:hypothetical protein
MGMLEEVKRMCENDLAASFVEGDRVGATLNKETGLYSKSLIAQQLVILKIY